jgi:hypothetical protein
MDDRELEYHKALQPVYEKAMGPWQVGDKFTCYELDGIDGVHSIHTFTTWDEELDKGCPHCIRLPLPIDPVNPERGLWGMVDWEKWDASSLAQGKLRIVNSRPNVFSETWFDVMDIPTLSLLQVLTAQHGLGGRP